MAGDALLGDGRARLIRDALSHPGFAHVPLNRLRGVVHQYINFAEADCAINWTIPAMRSFFFSDVARRLGVHCCLCSAIRREPGHRTSVPFCKWLCGDFDASGVAAFRTHPLCGNCNAKILLNADNKPMRGVDRYFQPILSEDRFELILCAIWADPYFRKRAEANAETAKSLRFDPRIGRGLEMVAA